MGMIVLLDKNMGMIVLLDNHMGMIMVKFLKEHVVFGEHPHEQVRWVAREPVEHDHSFCGMVEQHVRFFSNGSRASRHQTWQPVLPTCG